MSSIYGVSFYPRKLKPLYWIYIEHHSGFFSQIFVIYFCCRNLREARDNALEEKERACVSEKETTSKYDLLQSE